MTDKDNCSNNKSEDWLKKIKKERNGATDDQQHSSPADGNKDEAEERPVNDANSNKDNSDCEVEITQNEIPDVGVADDPYMDVPPCNAEANNEKLGQSEKMSTLSGHEVSAEKATNILDLLPENIYAHFLIIDIDSYSGVVCSQPKYIAINQSKTLIGRYSKAHIYLDDPESVDIKHAKVIFEEKSGEKAFVIYPIDKAIVSVNGNKLSGDGLVLKSGDKIEIGRIKLIFFHCPVEGILS